MFASIDYAAATAIATGNTVTCTMINVGLGVPPNRCDYFATPADVMTPHGTPAAAFANFPIT